MGMVVRWKCFDHLVLSLPPQIYDFILRKQPIPAIFIHKRKRAAFLLGKTAPLLRSKYICVIVKLLETPPQSLALCPDRITVLRLYQYFLY